MTLELRKHGDGVVLRVQAVPGSRRNAILGVRNGALRVAVTQVAEKGKANEALIEVLAKQLGLRKSHVGLLAGERSPRKQFLVESITVSELRERITAYLQDHSS